MSHTITNTFETYAQAKETQRLMLKIRHVISRLSTDALSDDDRKNLTKILDSAVDAYINSDKRMLEQKLNELLGRQHVNTQSRIT